MAEVWQLAGSLAAVAVLVLLVRLARLGPSPAFSDEEEARRAAALVIDYFEPKEIAIGKNRGGALLADEEGQVLLLRAHGAHHAGRLLLPPARAWLDGGDLMVDPADRRFGVVRLALPRPEDWLRRINRV